MVCHMDCTPESTKDDAPAEGTNIAYYGTLCEDSAMAREGLTTAFWSYAHSDDEGLGGKVARLKQQVDHAFKRHSGEVLESFFDRENLEWGEEWRSKINTTISGTTFFIAVVSPSYLKSPNCRDEFMEFWEGAQGSELKELLLPILWVSVYPETSEENRIWEIAQERQYIDWTTTRKLGESDILYTNLIDAMGERVAAVARELKNKPEDIEPPSTDGFARLNSDTDGTSGGYHNVDSVGDADTPGLVELYAEATAHVDSLVGSINAAMEVFNRIPQEVSTDALPPSASAHKRLLAFRKLADDITPYADEFERRAKQAEQSARLLNKTMFSVIHLMSDPIVRSTAIMDDAGRFRALPEELAHKLSVAPTMRAQMSSIGRLSRDLRAPFAAIERGCDSLDAIVEIVAEFSAALAKLADEPPEQIEG